MHPCVLQPKPSLLQLRKSVHAHARAALQPGVLHFFFCLLLQGGDLGSRPVLAGAPLGAELQPVRGADGLLEEALLAQKLLHGIVLPHLVLLYDLGKWPLVRSWTGAGRPEQGQRRQRLRGRKSPEEKSVQGQAVRTARAVSFHC